MKNSLTVVSQQLKQGKISITQAQLLHQAELLSKKKLQGQRKIEEIVFLELSTAKVIFIGIPVILSIIGIYFLLKHINFRIKVFFEVNLHFDAENTTHIFAIIEDETTELSKIQQEQYENNMHYTFVAQLLKYQVIENGAYPVSTSETGRLKHVLRSKNWHQNGLRPYQYSQRLNFFGANEHGVEIPGYFAQMFQIMSEPLFLLQYCIFGIWIIQQLYINTFANFGFCLAICTVNYLIQYYNFSKIKHMAQKQFKVKAIRDGRFVQVTNIDIVPGDIYEIKHNIPCDSVVLKGDIMVNEVNFTGENLPILKCQIEDTSQMSDTTYWIFQGSEILRVKEGSLAMAIHTGYTSHRGQIIRKIIKHTVKEPQFTHIILKFFIIAYIIAGLIYLTYLAKLMTMRIREDTIIFLFFQIVSLAVPIGYIGVINFFPGISLIRLNLNHIYGQEPYKVYESAQIRTICFDKTGTLTNNSVELADIYQTNSKGCTKVTRSFEKMSLFQKLFATCHMVRQVEEDVFKGDQIDLRMFQKSGAEMVDGRQESVLWEVALQGESLEVLRVNQFESKHMSMSVLIRCKKNGQHFVFVKGSPELMQKNAINRCKGVQDLVKQLSFQGFRTIGIGYKSIQQSKVSEYLKNARQMYLKDIQMMGVVSFVNKLKPEAADVVWRLRNEVKTDIKMITGDNIYTAVQTAFKAGIFTDSDTVIVCQAQNLLDKQSNKIKAIVIQNVRGDFRQSQKMIDSLYDFLIRAQEGVFFALEGQLLDDCIYQPSVFQKIKVFARVSPQNKTAIVKKFKGELERQQEERTAYNRWFGSVRGNVCMVGDGANDLMAIKQSDVGIGLSESDGTSSADFVISHLEQIQAIIRQGKAISQTAIETLIMFFVNTWLYIPLMLLTLHDLCTFSDEAMFYKNVAFTIPIPLFMGLTRPRKQNTALAPQMNILAPRHQLIIWICNLTFTIGFAISFWLYWRSDDFEVIHRGWVTMDDQFTKKSKSSTLSFKVIVAHCIAVIFVVYQNRPWKEPLTKNIGLAVWLILNLMMGYIVFFHQEWLKFMHLIHLSDTISIEVLIVMSFAFLVSLVGVHIVYRCSTLSREYYKN